MSGSIKQLIFSLLLCLLFLPLVQSLYPVVKEQKLNGFYRLKPKPELKNFTWKRWFSGEFQSVYAERIEDHIPLRNTLFRIHNEADYRLFNLIHAEGFISGKKGYLYEEGYINEYTGKYFIGKSAIDEKLEKLKRVTEILKNSGTDLVFVIEPGKASFYPEYIPDRYHPGQRTISNMDYFLQRLNEMGVNYLDLNRYFLLMKDTCRYPLFTKYGMHWSLYGAFVGADTIGRYVARLRNRTIPEMKITSVTVSDSLRWTDRDIADMLNVIFPVRKTTAAYPEISVSGKKPRPGVSVLTVGDSYYINIITNYSGLLFGRNDYWYYNSKLYPHIIEDENPVYVDKSNLAQQLRQYNVILLTVSEVNFHCGFWNFIDECYEALNPGYRDTWVYRYENKIRNVPEWFGFMVTKAKANHTTVERIIRKDAEFIVYTNFDKLENKTRRDTMFYLARKIRLDWGLMEQVRRNAAARNIPVQEMIRIEADSMYRRQNKIH